MTFFVIYLFDIINCILNEDMKDELSNYMKEKLKLHLTIIFKNNLLFRKKNRKACLIIKKIIFYF